MDTIVGKEEFCEGCVYGRSKHKHHPITSTKTRWRLERIHIDLCRPLPNLIGRNCYFLLIVDEHTHYQWVKFLPKKSDAFICLQRWKLQVKWGTDLKLQYLKSDRGKEFGSKVFEEWLTSDGVIHEKSMLYEHEQNGLAERGIQNVSQWAMCQLFSVNMSEGFWPYAVETAIYLINRSLTTTLDNKTPFKAWTGKCPSVRHLHTFGETGYVHIPPETHKKWTKKSCLCRFLGYMPRSRNYKLWDPNQHMVVVSPNINFDKSSTACSTADTDHGLDGLQDAFRVWDTPLVEGTTYTETKTRIKTMDNNASEWELDTEIL